MLSHGQKFWELQKFLVFPKVSLYGRERLWSYCNQSLHSSQSGDNTHCHHKNWFIKLYKNKHFHLSQTFFQNCFLLSLCIVTFCAWSVVTRNIFWRTPESEAQFCPDVEKMGQEKPDCGGCNAQILGLVVEISGKRSISFCFLICPKLSVSTLILICKHILYLRGLGYLLISSLAGNLIQQLCQVITICSAQWVQDKFANSLHAWVQPPAVTFIQLLTFV